MDTRAESESVAVISIGMLACTLQTTVGRVQRALTILGAMPRMTIDNVPHYDEAVIEAVREALGRGGRGRGMPLET